MLLSKYNCGQINHSILLASISLRIYSMINKSFIFHLRREARRQDRLVGGNLEGEAKQGGKGAHQNKNWRKERAILVYILNRRHYLGLKDEINASWSEWGVTWGASRRRRRAQWNVRRRDVCSPLRAATISKCQNYSLGFWPRQWRQWNEYLYDAGEKAGGTKQDNGCHLHPGVWSRLIEEYSSGEAGNGNGDETTTEDEKSPSASSLWSILEIVAWRRCGDEPGQ